MHKSATKCNETVGKWCKNKHGASKIIDTLETYQASGPSRSSGRRRRRIAICYGKVIGYLGFSHWGAFIGEGAMSEVEPGGLTPWRRGQALGHASVVCRAPVPPSYSPSDLWKLPDKIRLQELVLSNSENIFCVSLLKHKNSRKQGTGTVATC
jgi:hypothetical protein